MGFAVCPHDVGDLDFCPSLLQVHSKSILVKIVFLIVSTMTEKIWNIVADRLIFARKNVDSASRCASVALSSMIGWKTP